MPLLDTNVLLRHLLQDHPAHSPRASAYLQRVERGEVEVQLTDTILFESVFMLEKYYKQERGDIAHWLLPLINLPGIVMPGKERYRDVFEVFTQHRVSFADAFHGVVARRLKPPEVISFDQDFDRISGIRRVEP